MNIRKLESPLFINKLTKNHYKSFFSKLFKKRIYNDEKAIKENIENEQKLREESYNKPEYYLKAYKSSNNNNNTIKTNFSNDIDNNHIESDITEINPKNYELQNINFNSYSLEELNEKYAIYKNYNPIQIFKKDEDFGNVIKYEEYLEEGLERFSEPEILNNLNKTDLKIPKAFNELTNLIDNQLKMYHTNFKEEYKYKLTNTQQRWYKEAIFDSTHLNEADILNEENRLGSIKNNSRKVKIRNFTKYADDLHYNAKEPTHEEILSNIQTKFEEYQDKFDYLKKSNHPSSLAFKEKEKEYCNKKMTRYSRIEERILEELVTCEDVSNICPVEFGNDIMVFKNKRDMLTLYGFDNSNQEIKGERRGNFNRNYNDDIDDISNKESILEELFDIEDKEKSRYNKNSKIKKNTSDSDPISTAISEITKNIYNKIKQLFGLNDLLNLSKKYNSLEFINYIKSILDRSDDGYVFGENIIHKYYFSPDNKFLVIVTKTENLSNTAFDFIIKDLERDILVPIIFKNSDGNIAFDKSNGIYYTQLNKQLRPDKVFRHQIGIEGSDSLVYFEKNTNFKVKCFNCNSMEMTYIEISGYNQVVESNEIWYRKTEIKKNESSKDNNDTKENSYNKDFDFKCLKKIQLGIKYNVSYSSTEKCFYILANEDMYNTIDKSLMKIYIEEEAVKRLAKSQNINDQEKKMKEKKDSSETKENLTSSSSDIELTSTNSKLQQTQLTSQDDILDLAIKQNMMNNSLHNAVTLSDIEKQTSSLQLFNIRESIINKQNSKVKELVTINNSNNEISLIREKELIPLFTGETNIKEFLVTKDFLITHEILNNNTNKEYSSKYYEYFRIKKLNKNSDSSNTEVIFNPRTKLHVILENSNNEKIKKENDSKIKQLFEQDYKTDYSTNYELIENLNYNSYFFRYKESSISTPIKTYDYSLGTNRLYLVHQNYYQSIIDTLETLHSETVFVKVRDGFEIPLLLYYDKTYHKDFNFDSMYEKDISTTDDNNANSNSRKIILFSPSNSFNKANIEFDEDKISLLNRGFILCYPIVRGTQFFDYNYFENGIIENKFHNVTDYIDVCLLLKNKKIAYKLISYNEKTGAIRGIISLFNTNCIIDLLVFSNGVFDLMELSNSKNNTRDMLNKLFNSNNKEDNDSSENDLNKILHNLKIEFGNFSNDELSYEVIKMFSSYQLSFNKSIDYPSILFMSDSSYPLYYQTQKMVARLRQANANNVYLTNIPIFDFVYNDCEEKDYEYERKLFSYSFIIGEMNINKNTIQSFKLSRNNRL